MPQPLSRSRLPENLEGPGYRALRARPVLGLHVGIIAAQWTDVEMQLGFLLSGLLGTSDTYGMNMYASLQSDSAKRAVLAEVARLSLDQEDLLAFDVIQNEIRVRGRERNRIVHGGWLFSPSIPDALIWHDHRAFYRRVDRAGNTALEHELWAESDFVDVELRLTELNSKIQAFNRVVREHISKRGEASS